MQRKNGVKTCLNRASSNSLGSGSANFGQYSAIFSKCASATKQPYDPERSIRDSNTLKSRYLEYSWRCYLATIRKLLCSRLSAILATAWLLVVTICQPSVLYDHDHLSININPQSLQNAYLSTTSVLSQVSLQRINHLGDSVTYESVT